MKKPFKNYYQTSITCKAKEEGESIEQLLRRMTENKEPIPQNVPPIYTERKDGVLPDYDIRADRWDVAMEAQDKFAASEIAKGAEKPTVDVEKKEPEQKEPEKTE